VAHTARNKAEYTQHRGDRARVLAAVEQAGGALRHATQDLRGDRKVVLRAVRQSGWALADASLELRADPSVVREVASKDIRMVFPASFHDGVPLSVIIASRVSWAKQAICQLTADFARASASNSACNALLHAPHCAIGLQVLQNGQPAQCCHDRHDRGDLSCGLPVGNARGDLPVGTCP
jgi:hypothetical protein